EWLRSVDNPYYMDGRARPSEYAAHTWGGFSTAEFVGDMLKITTTHLKEDYYRRNGVPSSDRATLTQYWIRRGDYLTWVTIAYDPLYLTDPMIRSSEYRFSNHRVGEVQRIVRDRKSTRLNSSHSQISYAVFC